jgi:flagellar basal-body rod modification protein FlgD
MGTAAAIFNHALTAGPALSGTGVSPMAGSTNGANGTQGSSGTDGTNDTSSSSATISANDFLTLLVTEMQNQDPTADTDPNEYINQLVQVNSLEQLIDINQTLGGALDPTTPASGSGASRQVAALPGGAAADPAVVPAAAQPSASGNLGVPAANAAAGRVGHALDGMSHARPAKGSAIALQ